MGNERPTAGGPVSNDLHPRTFLAIAGFALWLVLAVWTFFSRGSYSSISDIAVTGLVLIAFLIPLALWRAGRSENSPKGITFREWIGGDVETSSGQLHGHEAFVQVLLPIAAVAIGMTLFGLAFYFTAPAA